MKRSRLQHDERVSSKLRQLARSEQGSLLVEATLTYPAILLCTLLLLGVGLVAYSRAELEQTAVLWAERAAYVWSDSHKDAQTGAFTYQQMDGLYEPLLKDGLGLFLAVGRSMQTASISLPGHAAHGSGPTLQKLKRSLPAEPEASQLTGKVSAFNRVLEQEVQMSVSRSVQPGAGGRPPLVPSSWIGGTATASAYPLDGTELLRTVDLLTSWGTELKRRFGTPSQLQDEMGSILPSGTERPSIRSEREAKAYLQKLVHGEPMEVRTSRGLRQIDAMDSDGLMHEAKYTVNLQDAKDQIQKDMELMRTGAVKGVVWHFFPLVRTGQPDLPLELKRRLEDSGILVVIHR